MKPHSRLFLFLGALNMMLVVMLGAFGAHALKTQLTPDSLAVYQTAVHYHAMHALGLLALGCAAQHIQTRLLPWAGWLLLAGILLFCGSLYVLSITGPRALGIITPFGGTAFILAWALFALALRKL